MKCLRLSISALAFAVLLTVPAVQAAQPNHGRVADPNISAEWNGGPYTVGIPNQLGCAGPSDPTCDAFSLHIDLPYDYRVSVAIWSDVPADDYDLYVYYPDGTEAGRSATGGTEAVVITHTAAHGTGLYQVRVLPFTVTPGSTYRGYARSTSQAAFDEDPNACLEAVPAALGLPLDLGQKVSLDVAVLLDDVSQVEAEAIMNRAKVSYAPIGVNLKVKSYTPVTFQGTEGADLIQQAKNFYGGTRPPGADLVYVLSSKNLTTGGDTSLAGLADCIGGVRFAHHAFAVGEAVSWLDESLLGPFRLNVDAYAEVAAHELGHLMGVHHHYANCVEGNLQGDPDDLSPCTLMFNFVDFQSLNFSLLEGAVARGHAVQFASP